METVNIKIQRNELTARAFNVLHFQEIKTVGQLAALTEPELRKFRNCGRRTVNELREYLQNRGLDLASTHPPEIVRLKYRIEQLHETLASKDAEIAKLKTQLNRLAQLPLGDSLILRLAIQVDRFEQLMSKVFRPERREALMHEIEKLDNGQSP